MIWIFAICARPARSPAQCQNEMKTEEKYCKSGSTTAAAVPICTKVPKTAQRRDSNNSSSRSNGDDRNGGVTALE